MHVRNHTDQLTEAIFVPVRSGTTAADVQRAFEIIDAGGWPQNSPLVGRMQAARGMHTLVAVRG